MRFEQPPGHGDALLRLRYPLHRLAESTFRLLAHCDALSQTNLPAAMVLEVRQAGELFLEHFRQLDLLRSRLAQFTEELERP